MKILNLLIEGKFSKSDYAYHVTSDANIPSILKRGLIPNYTSNGYGSDERSELGYNLTPLSGVYFTSTTRDALFIAKILNGIIVVAKIQKKRSDLDEDILRTSVIDERQVRTTFLHYIENKLTPSTDIAERDVMAFAERYTSKAINDKFSTLHPTRRTQLYAPILAYVYTIVNYVLDDIEHADPDETELKHAQSVLSKKLRFIMKTNPSAGDRFKLDATVTFAGANRIVGMYNPRTRLGWGDIGGFEEYAYHKVPYPLKLVQN